MLVFLRLQLAMTEIGFQTHIILLSYISRENVDEMHI